MLKKVKTVSDVWNWSRQVLVPALKSGNKWYNDKSTDSISLFADYSSYLLTYPIIRQLRSKNSRDFAFLLLMHSILIIHSSFLLLKAPALSTEYLSTRLIFVMKSTTFWTRKRKITASSGQTNPVSVSQTPLWRVSGTHKHRTLMDTRTSVSMAHTKAADMSTE